VRYRYEVRIGPDDVGERVVVRWRRPAPGGGEEVADVVGALEGADQHGFAVRNRRGELVAIPRERALAAKVIPPR
jgi:N-acetylglutamate synthase